MQRAVMERVLAPSTSALVVLSATPRHHKDMQVFKNKVFWQPCIMALVILSAFFAWELGYFGDMLPRLPRPTPTRGEILYTIVLIALLSLNSGLIFFRLKQGNCPLGAKRASTIAGGLGVVTLLCPACLLIPISLFGISLSLTFLAPFLPLLRVIVLFLLIVSTVMLFPNAR